MALTDPYRKETVHLWFAICILLILSIFRILAAAASEAFSIDSDALLPIPGWIPNALCLLVVAVLWIAYHRWTHAIRRRKEFEFVIKGISPDMIMVIDPNRRITMCNEAVKTVLGYSPKEIIGQGTDLLYFDRRVTGERHEIYNQIKQVGFHTGFAKGKRKDGSVIPLEIVTGELPHQPGAIILVRDITERKDAEDQLIEAKETAEAAHAELKEMERMRDNLTHMIVHDLKSPLTAICGYLELLTRYCAEKLDKKEAGFLGEAMALTRRLGEMINSLLDLRRLESDEMPINREVHDLRKLAEDAFTIVGPEANVKNVLVQLPHNSVFAFCDGEIIRRVIVNLLSNAVKFTPEGGNIMAALEPFDDTAKMLVTDTGQGIPKEFHEKVFERFAQVEVREFSTGLGLTFCKLAVEAHGGRIGVESETGKGSTLWFELPATPDTKAQPQRGSETARAAE